MKDIWGLQTAEMVDWLREINMSVFVQFFQNQQVDGKTATYLQIEDLDRIGVGTPFQRRQLLRIISKSTPVKSDFQLAGKPSKKSCCRSFVVWLAVTVIYSIGAIACQILVSVAAKHPLWPFGPHDLGPVNQQFKPTAYEALFQPVPGIPSYAGRCNGAKTEVAFAVGIVSAAKNFDRRAAIRGTWLNHSRYSNVTEHRFFIGSIEGAHSDKILAEAELHRDMIFIGAADTYKMITYKVVALFQWGIEQCGAHYVIRTNDDVYLRLDAIFAELTKSPPVRVYAGHMYPEGAAVVVRPGDADYQCFNEADCTTKAKTLAAVTVSHGTYPSDIYTAFAQGNAVVLSRDLAEVIASLVHKPWVNFFADDLLIGMLVAFYQPRVLNIKADTSTHSGPTLCTDDSVNHFDIGPESMYLVHQNMQSGRRRCSGIDVFPD